MFGYGAINTVEGNIDADESVLLTLIERKTRFEKIFKVSRQRAADVDRTLKVFFQKLKGLEGQIFKSVTSDNGSEFATLSQLPTKTDIYFCHPCRFLRTRHKRELT